MAVPAALWASLLLWKLQQNHHLLMVSNLYSVICCTLKVFIWNFISFYLSVIKLMIMSLLKLWDLKGIFFKFYFTAFLLNYLFIQNVQIWSFEILFVQIYNLHFFSNDLKFNFHKKSVHYHLSCVVFTAFWLFLSLLNFKNENCSLK